MSMSTYSSASLAEKRMVCAGNFHAATPSTILLLCFDKFDNVISPAPAIIAPPRNGNPAPTKSARDDEKRKGKQKSIPRAPKMIAAYAPNLANDSMPVVFCDDGE